MKSRGYLSGTVLCRTQLLVNIMVPSMGKNVQTEVHRSILIKHVT